MTWHPGITILVDNTRLHSAALL